MPAWGRGVTASIAISLGLGVVLGVVMSSQWGQSWGTAPVPATALPTAQIKPLTTSTNKALVSAPKPSTTKAATPSQKIEKSTPAKASVALLMDSSVRQGEVLFVTVTPLSEGTPAATGVPHHLHWNGGGGKDIPLFKQPSGHYEGVVPVRVDHPLGAGGVTVMTAHNDWLASHPVTVTSGGFAKQNIEVSKSMGGLNPEPGEMEAIGKLKTQTNPSQRWWSKSFQLPVPDCMNSPFGNLRYHNNHFTGNFHKGIDQRSPQGRVVKAPTGGVVKIAQTFRLHGGTVGLDHGQGLSSIYIHLSKINVKPGQRVKAGDILGQVGATGFATGPHLHWGLFVHGVPVNPTQWVQPDVC
ncbi:MAG: M23 family metallopeptidase [Vampirovibrionales bacterium]